MTMNLPQGNEDNRSSCEHEVMLALGQSLPQGSSLSWVHVNRPLDKLTTTMHQLDAHIVQATKP